MYTRNEIDQLRTELQIMLHRKETYDEHNGLPRTKPLDVYDVGFLGGIKASIRMLDKIKEQYEEARERKKLKLAEGEYRVVWNF